MSSIQAIHLNFIECLLLPRFHLPLPIYCQWMGHQVLPILSWPKITNLTDVSELTEDDLDNCDSDDLFDYDSDDWYMYDACVY